MTLVRLTRGLFRVLRGAGRATGDLSSEGSAFTCVACAALAIVLMARLAAAAQDVTEPALKAAFIYNFLRFTEWPDPLPASAPYVICVGGDDDVRDALTRDLKTRVLAGHPILVSQPTDPGRKQPCHILYLSGVPAGQAAKVLAASRDLSILTISDIEGFNQAGGMVQFFFEDGRLRFFIRNERARQAKLRISSTLLTLAKRYE